MTLLYPNAALAVPYGVEVQLAFGGLTLNAGKNMYTGQPMSAAVPYVYQVTSIGGLDDAEVAYASEARPDMHGELPLNVFYRARTITIEGTIRALNLYQLRVAQQNLREAFGRYLVEQQLVFSTGSAAQDVYIYCRKNQSLQMKETTPASPAAHLRREFQVSLRASDPRFLAYNATTAQSSLNPSNNANVVCTSNGTFSSYPTITIIGPFNAGLTITNSQTNLAFKLSSAVPSSRTLTIDTLAKTVVDDLGVNRYAYLDPTSRWITVEPGSQNMTLSGVAGGSGASRVSFSWRDAWI